MKKSCLSFILMTIWFVNSFSQNATVNVKLNYPECTLINESVITETKEVKNFVISTQEEFDKYFKLKDNYTINFENSMVLVGFVGQDNSNKNISMNGATLKVKRSILYIKSNITEKPNGTCGKYCVVVIKKIDYKKILFLNGKKYNRAKAELM